MKVFVNKNLKCSIEIQFVSDSHAITPEMARELVVELEKALEQVEEVLPGIEAEPKGIPGKDFIPVDWVDTLEMYGKWKIVKV